MSIPNRKLDRFLSAHEVEKAARLDGIAASLLCSGLRTAAAR
jgi:hypothetical protein